MKKRILNYCINAIKKNSDNKYDDEKLAEIRYGLEAIYLTITKVIVIFTVSLILGIFKEMLILTVLYSVLRNTGHGIHAKKSWMCLTSSLIIFVGAPFLALNITIPISAKIILCGLCVVAYYLYSPADTEKHPLVNEGKRRMYRKITVLLSLIYTFVCLYSTNEFLSNTILFSLMIEAAMVLPISYKIFKLPYNNYKTYVFQN